MYKIQNILYYKSTQPKPEVVVNIKFFFVWIVLVLFSNVTIAGEPGPVTFVTGNPTAQQGTVYAESEDAELCKMDFTANTTEHGNTTMHHLKFVLVRGGPNLSPINWNTVVGGEYVLDQNIRNITITDENGATILSYVTPSLCPGSVVTFNSYTCDIEIPSVTFGGQKTFTALVDIDKDAGRFSETTWITSLGCGYVPPVNPNVTGVTSGATDFAPRVTTYGQIRPYEWRGPLLADGFE